MKNSLMRLRNCLGALLCVCLLLSNPMAAWAELTPNDYDAIIRNRPYYDATDEACVPIANTQISGTDNIAKIYNYLIGKTVAGQPLKDFQVAGILGNMQSESAYNEQRLQGTFPATVRTPAANVPRGQAGKAWGVVQWDPAHKMIDPVTAAGKDPNDLNTQLDFLISQLDAGAGTLDGRAGIALAASTNVADATLAFETKFERHAGSPKPARVVEAERILNLANSGNLQGSGNATGKPVIVLDPGHGGATINRTDPQTGLHDGDYNNTPERTQVFAVAQIAKTQLEQAGYSVVMTKNTADESVFLRDRANVANSSQAAMAVSIHTQGDKAFGTWQEIYAQKVGLYRGAGAQKQTFTDAAIATKSQQYAAVMKQARDASEVTSGTTVIKDNTFDGRPPIEPGNIPLVELWAQVPWIYLEAGGNNLTTGLTEQQKATYANAIAAGVKTAVPLAAPTINPSACGLSNNAGLTATVLAYAWPEYHRAPYLTMKPEYAEAVAQGASKNLYVGGNQHRGIDCGGFVTLLMINSGFEPNYNYGGVKSAGASNVAIGQKPWLDANWELIGRVNSTSELQPGDVAIKVNLAHTYVFVGDISGFANKTASASLDERSPMSSGDNVTDSDFVWYRKK